MPIGNPDRMPIPINRPQVLSAVSNSGALYSDPIARNCLGRIVVFVESANSQYRGEKLKYNCSLNPIASSLSSIANLYFGWSLWRYFTASLILSEMGGLHTLRRPAVSRDRSRVNSNGNQATYLSTAGKSVQNVVLSSYHTSPPCSSRSIWSCKRDISSGSR